MMRQARPDMLRGEEGTEVDLEAKVAARLFAAGWRATERRTAQRDPAKLSALRRPVVLPGATAATLLSPLERWERILGLTPAAQASLTERRAAVKAKLVATASTRRAAVVETLGAIFGSWLVEVREFSASDVDYAGRVPAGTLHAFWASALFAFSAEHPGEFSSSWPWSSALCSITVEVRPPAATEPALARDAVGKAIRALDEQLPAWMGFVISQQPPEQTAAGFYLDTSLLDETAL